MVEKLMGMRYRASLLTAVGNHDSKQPIIPAKFRFDRQTAVYVELRKGGERSVQQQGAESTRAN